MPGCRSPGSWTKRLRSRWGWAHRPASVAGVVSRPDGTPLDSVACGSPARAGRRGDGRRDGLGSEGRFLAGVARWSRGADRACGGRRQGRSRRRRRLRRALRGVAQRRRRGPGATRFGVLTAALTRVKRRPCAARDPRRRRAPTAGSTSPSRAGPLACPAVTSPAWCWRRVSHDPRRRERVLRVAPCSGCHRR